MRTAEECHFETHDGMRLFYRHWPALQKAEGALVLFHRGHEHSGRLQHLVDELDLPGFEMFAWDARGHGHSPQAPGSVPTVGTFVKDVDSFVHYISTKHGIAFENIAVVGQSVGGVLVAAWVHDYAPKIRCMVLATPAFKVKLYVPFARFGLSLFHRMFGEFHVTSYVKARALTHDPERIASYQSDPLITKAISAEVLLGLYTTSERIIKDAQAIQVPTQMLVSGTDWVVHLKPQLDFVDRLGSAVKEKHVFKGFFHDTLGEKDRHLPIAKLREFVTKMFAIPVTPAALLDADKRGFTKEEFDALSRPLPAVSIKRLNFGMTKLGMKTGGRLSDGIRLGLETGFDSGNTLDYVYRNQASGITPLGKLIDWFYLNSIGWRGIRLRKQNIERLLTRSIEMLRSSGREVRILDIAAGQGRYVLDALARIQTNGDRALLRDYTDLNVRMGQALIREKGLEGIARFEKGDAFDRASLAAIRPRPTVGVVSGLYELFPENGPVRTSLDGLADAIEPGGYLVYTGQPWHPQLEMIARTLSSHRDHQPWIMRRRSQAELDQLVETAGFQKMDELIDDWGIFTVSLARRINA